MPENENGFSGLLDLIQKHIEFMQKHKEELNKKLELIKENNKLISNDQIFEKEDLMEDSIQKDEKLVDEYEKYIDNLDEMNKSILDTKERIGQTSLDVDKELKLDNSNKNEKQVKAEEFLQKKDKLEGVMLDAVSKIDPAKGALLKEGMNIGKKVSDEVSTSVLNAIGFNKNNNNNEENNNKREVISTNDENKDDELLLKKNQNKDFKIRSQNSNENDVKSEMSPGI